MTLLDKLPRSENGEIILSPGGKVDGTPVNTTVSPVWFSENFPDLATAELPLTEDLFQRLRGIDPYWRQNAERWRSEGLI